MAHLRTYAAYLRACLDAEEPIEKFHPSQAGGDVPSEPALEEQSPQIAGSHAADHLAYLRDPADGEYLKYLEATADIVKECDLRGKPNEEAARIFGEKAPGIYAARGLNVAEASLSFPAWAGGKGWVQAKVSLPAKYPVRMANLDKRWYELMFESGFIELVGRHDGKNAHVQVLPEILQNSEASEALRKAIRVSNTLVATCWVDAFTQDADGREFARAGTCYIGGGFTQEQDPAAIVSLNLHESARPAAARHFLRTYADEDSDVATVPVLLTVELYRAISAGALDDLHMPPPAETTA